MYNRCITDVAVVAVVAVVTHASNLGSKAVVCLSVCLSVCLHLGGVWARLGPVWGSVGPYWALFGLPEALLCFGHEWQNNQVGLLGGAPLGPHKFPFGCPVLPFGTILCACWGHSGANDLGDVLGPSGAAEANQKQTAVH